MSVAAKLRDLRWRAAGHLSRPLPEAFIAPLRGERVLEIGGPSAVFGADGLLPLYQACAAVDCVQWSSETVWHGALDPGPFAPEGTTIGTLHVVDDPVLASLPADAYGAVASSHVLEHLANPLQAIEGWRRVTRPGGGLLLVAPHREGTFDHRRAVTSLEHFMEDYVRGTGEDDLTHLDETLRLHDRTRDAEPGSDDEWAQRRRDNLRHRVLHHHVFTTASLVALLAHAGVDVDALEVRYPHDIYVAGRFREAPAPVPEELVGRALRGSPFRGDRQAARRPAARPTGREGAEVARATFAAHRS